MVTRIQALLKITGTRKDTMIEKALLLEHIGLSGAYGAIHYTTWDDVVLVQYTSEEVATEGLKYIEKYKPLFNT